MARALFPHLQVFDFGAQDVERLECVRNGYLALQSSPIPEERPGQFFSVDYEGSFARLRDHHRLVIAGECETSPRGYVRYVPHVVSNVRDASISLVKFFSGGCVYGKYQDKNGNTVSADVLSSLFASQGYHGGTVLDVQLFEAFYREKGIGRLMMQSLQSRKDVSAVFLTATPDSHSFYLKQGFNDLGICGKCMTRRCIQGLLQGCGKDEFVPMLWVNPSTCIS